MPTVTTPQLRITGTNQATAKPNVDPAAVLPERAIGFPVARLFLGFVVSLLCLLHIDGSAKSARVDGGLHGTADRSTGPDIEHRIAVRIDGSREIFH